MKWFRNTLAKNRAYVLALLTVSTFTMVGGPDFAYAHQLHQQKEQRLQEVADTLGIPVDQLRPDHLTLAETLGKAFGIEPEDPVKKAGLERLQKVLREHEEQLAANPYLSQIEQVKNEHAIYRIEGTLQDILQLTDPKGRKALRPGAKKAMMRNLGAAFDEGLKLAPLPEGLPAKAQQRHEEMQRTLDRITAFVRPVVEEAIEETSLDKSAELNPEKIVRMKQLVEGLVERTKRAPRFVDRPLPLRRAEKKARVQEISKVGTTQPSAALVGGTSKATVPSKAGIAPELQNLAAELDNSPAQIFSFVHNEVEFDPKWGAFKGSLETYWVRSGTPWEQAWLLRDLLVAAGVDARFEWGEVEIDPETLMNLTGVSDPWRAGDMMTTAGVPIVLLTQGSQVVKARMPHVWVKAYVDYIPNRGATAGPGDTWIRMDPSIKRFEFAPGIPIYEQVPFSLGDYLLSGTELSPRRAYEESLWDYIRANNIDCVTLEQLKKKGSILADDFAILPGTLRAKILEVSGEAVTLPDSFQQHVSVEVRRTTGESLLNWDVRQPATFGQRLEIAWQGATPADQATLDGYGGVFETPPYLVDLVPVVRLGGVDQAVGTAMGSAQEIEISVTTSPPGGVTDVFVHQGHAGEPSVLVTAFGKVPRELTDVFQAQLNAADSTGNEAEIEMATLQMLGAAYFQNLGRDTLDLAEWNWHRVVRLVSEGLAVQTGTVTTTAGGAPLTFERAERYVDFPGYVVGVFHANGVANQSRPVVELAGAQGSFLEGQVFDQVLADEGIAAVSALTRARREGQTITMVDASNVDTILATIGLSDEIESQVRQAVAQGKVAWIPELPITVNSWQGVGFIVEDPSSGAAAFLLDGGYAGGAGTSGAVPRLPDVFGNEAWLGPFGGLLQEFFTALGFLPQQSEPSTQYGDPVNLSNGNLWMTHQDHRVLAWPYPIELNRTYNSRSPRSGVFGRGWSSVLDEKLIPLASGAVLYLEDDGTEHVFEFNDVTGDYDSPTGRHLTLTESGGGWRVASKHGNYQSFDANGDLVALGDPSENEIVLQRDGSGRVQDVLDSYSRTVLTLSYNTDGYVSRAEDLVGRSTQYTYADGRLETVRDVAGDDHSYSYDERGLLSSYSNPGGSVDTWKYDSQQRCIAHTDALGAVESFSYTVDSAVVTDQLGRSSKVDFDERGRAVEAIDPFGSRRTASWDEDNNRTLTIDESGNEVIQEFDDRGNLTRIVQPTGEETTFDYNPLSLPERIVLPAGGERFLSYTPEGNLTKVEDLTDAGLVTSAEYDYNSEGQFTASKTDGGPWLQTTWSPSNGYLESTDLPDGGTVGVMTDDAGRVWETSQDGEVTSTFSYDDLDRVLSAIPASGERSLSVTYGPRDVPETIEVEGRTVTLETDLVGRVVRRTSPGQQNWIERFDPAGNLIEAGEESGGRTFYFHDALGRRVAVMAPNGAVSTIEYCGSEPQACVITDAQGESWKLEYDASGRLTRTTDPTGASRSIGYDHRGLKTYEEDALGDRKLFEYDAFGRLTAVVEPDVGRTAFNFDSGCTSCQTTEIIDALGRAWQRKFDAGGRLLETTDPLGNQELREYLPDGRLDSRTNASGKVLYYLYEGINLTSIRSDSRSGPEVVGFEFNSLGQLSRATTPTTDFTLLWDAEGRLAQETNEVTGAIVQYGYDTVGRLTELVGPGGTERYFYSPSGQLTVIQSERAGEFRFEYDSLGRRSKVSYPNDTETRYFYSARGDLDSTVTSRGDDIVSGFSYRYDGNGRRIEETSLTSQVVTEYEYDASGRLTRTEDSTGAVRVYRYDAVGNLLETEQPGLTTTYEYDAANRLLVQTDTDPGGMVSTRNFDWSPSGNLELSTRDGDTEKTYEYNSMDQLTQISGSTGTIGFDYDALGRRASETRSAGSTYFVNAAIGGFPHTIARTSSSGDAEWSAVYAKFVDEPLAEVDSDGEARYLYRDALGSVVASADGAGQLLGRTQFSPYGEVLGDDSSLASTQFGFTGREPIQGEEISYYRARHYDSGIKRFLTQDSYLGRLNSPLTLNRFSYVHGDPVNLSDPSGRTAVVANVARLALAAIYLSMAQQLMATVVYYLGWSGPEAIRAAVDAEGPVPLVYLGHVLGGAILGVGIVAVAAVYALVGKELIRRWKANAEVCGKYTGALNSMGVNPLGTFWAGTLFTTTVLCFAGLEKLESLTDFTNKGTWCGVALFAAACAYLNKGK